MEHITCLRCGSGCRSLLIEGPPKVHRVMCKNRRCKCAAEYFQQDGRVVTQEIIPSW
ncbi:hypothetical protein SAMN02745165_02803 [Malonomonas rubra DSM 5091]|uniref:Uncharacterized protein n=1 Tax=Malonomonas rubra DSM 5091 TaxID=1122189 RepID=A0A1M6KUJ6_MALRU|nr:hypothetical protein SAMN02745165_02803 [Malonomonas rubra DSM 5091]